MCWSWQGDSSWLHVSPEGAPPALFALLQRDRSPWKRQVLVDLCRQRDTMRDKLGTMPKAWERLWKDHLRSWKQLFVQNVAGGVEGTLSMQVTTWLIVRIAAGRLEPAVQERLDQQGQQERRKALKHGLLAGCTKRASQRTLITVVCNRSKAIVVV